MGDEFQEWTDQRRYLEANLLDKVDKAYSSNGWQPRWVCCLNRELVDEGEICRHRNFVR